METGRGGERVVGDTYIIRRRIGKELCHGGQGSEVLFDEEWVVNSIKGSREV